jgi:hypothetical protein
MSGLKTGIGYIKDSLSQILKGLILVVLATSGLGLAVLLRDLSYNGSAIASLSIALEAIGLILAYILLRKYVTIKEEDNNKRQKGKEKFK